MARDFWERHPDAKGPLEAWIDDAPPPDSRDAHDIKARYRSASPVGNKRVVFNIKGNDYRLIVAVAYRFGAVYIKFIGTHAE
ncbi:type II toxin-antitoxin system HigB family toxin, partial [Vreelandella neptunia]|uniref:type II toxin-antitoxin system HigB family toxin n=1 Tax=Vreelandella neptunia TaxID=115551 RepID=UPI0025B5EE5F